MSLSKLPKLVQFILFKAMGHDSLTFMFHSKDGWRYRPKYIYIYKSKIKKEKEKEEQKKMNGGARLVGSRMWH